MPSRVNDAVEAFTTIAPSHKSDKGYPYTSSNDYSYESSKNYPESVRTSLEEKTWDDSLTSTTRFTVVFWLCISLICLAICIVVCWVGHKPAPAQSTPSGSRSWFRTKHRSTPRTPRHRERSESIWSKVFSKGQNESKGWPAIRRFASWSKSRAGDIEMQRVQPVGNTLRRPGIWTGTRCVPARAGPTLHSGARGTRRLPRPEHSWSNRSRTDRWRAEAERQRSRDAWDRLDASEGAVETSQVTRPQPLASQPRLDSPVIPEPSAQRNVGRINDVPLPLYEPFRRAESPAPSIPEVAPPTYAQHQDDEVAYLYDYQDPAQAVEEIVDVQELLPYAPSWPPVPAPVLSSRRSGFIEIGTA